MRQYWSIAIDRAGCMMLDPLADVSIGVFVAVCVSRRQLVVDILGHSKRRKAQE